MLRLHASVLMFLLMISPAMSDAGPIGTVSENKGSACSIERGKNKLDGVKGASIESMDAYVTGGCASSITFKDDTKVRVTENSRLVIDDFVYDPKQSDSGKLALKVGMGTVRYASGQIAKTNPQQVAINTPTATIAVRGTDFTMTVDEAGQSMVVLLPSCKDPRDVKTYELEENRCRTGSITVTNAGGSVVLDQPFHGTYVSNQAVPPTTPVIINTVESKVMNNLMIISRPPELQRVIKEHARTKQEKDQEELDQEALMVERRARRDAEIAQARYMYELRVNADVPCDYVAAICVRWDDPKQEEQTNKGKGVAFREAPNEHYAEVKTQGYQSNTSITITQNDSVATYLIGDGSPGGNNISIKQSTGVLRK